ncbi:5'-methylthioadenosine/S-adenosylhomocysteine nucleosidase family protein [Dermatobacter hominis]|uniref:5'-methylthioadenosine/S-adenosylhomocysteine nucleosidase family protein n=1 Tax=Dermatobacter hominis TaxID=2884263 RepID=UPI001D1051F2|nr:hypothetical protein [Dermatobacter hominis]UDY35026.1 hypothetical protein LH044_17010 [Dermatobacter hominis]
MAEARVAILAPMDVEVRPVVSALRVRRLDDGRAAAWGGRVGDVEVTVHMVGIGPDHAGEVTEHVVRRYSPDRLVVCGIAGGLAAGLGDLVVPAEVIDAATGERFESVPWGPLEPSGAIVTTDGIWPADRLADHAAAGVHAVDMETSAVAAVAGRHGLAWTAFRGISDLVGAGTVDEATLALTRPDGTADVRAALRHAAGAPSRVPGLVKVAVDTRRATRVATAAVVAAVGGG